MNRKQTRGMVLGKFMPPHLGHVYLLEFAKNYVDELTIVVETQRGQPIDGALRYQWVQEMFPQVQVVHLTDENPQDPSEHPEFWKIWHDSLRSILPFDPDFVFASEEYGWKLAATLDAQFVPVDIDRDQLPISGTQIRENPLRHWQYIPRIVRPYFAKRICVFGPESTGKSTLARQLANHFQTTYVPEYARTHIEARQGELESSDIPMIARGQLASESALAYNANRLLFCDTDLLTTKIWSEWLFGNCPEWIVERASEQQYDLYLVTDVDVPWVEDQVRFLPNERKSFLDRCLSELQRCQRRYVLLSGSWEDRYSKAVASVEENFDLEN